MRRNRLIELSVLFCFIMVSLVSCKPAVPSNYIQPGDMEDILYDYHLAGSMADHSENDSVNTQKYRAAVLKKYGYTIGDFDNSMLYYMRHTERLKAMYKNIEKRLQDESVALGSSAEDLEKFGNISSAGDTANIWKVASAMVLSMHKPFNLQSFQIDADTTFHKGDNIMLDFDAQFIFQDGMRDGIAVLAVTFKNDSVASQNIHISSPSHYSVSIKDNDHLGIKNIKGFIMLNKSQDPGQSNTTLKLMIVTNIKLIRMHEDKKQIEEKARQDSIDRVRQDSISKSVSKAHTVPIGNRLPPPGNSGMPYNAQVGNNVATPLKVRE